MKASEYYKKVKGSKNLKEDALDDFDIDGSIRKSNIEAMGNENLQQAIKAYKEDCFEQVEYVVQDLLKEKGLEQVRSADPKVGQYRITCADNIFGGSVRIGSTFSIKIRLGYYWGGILPEHKKMLRGNRLRDVERIVKEIKEEIKGRIDCQEVYDRVIESSSGIERCAGMISVSFKITEDALEPFYESHKSNKNSLNEDGKAFSSLYKMPKVEFDKWQKATSKEGLAKTVDIDGVKACYVDEYNDTYKKMMPKHIGTWNPEEETLTCDDVSLFGVELPESRRVKEDMEFRPVAPYTNYKEWVGQFAPGYDVSNEEAYKAGAELVGCQADHHDYEVWVGQFAPGYDVSNEEAFEGGKNDAMNFTNEEGFESEYDGEVYHHPNAGINDCSCCGQDGGTKLLINWLEGTEFDTDWAEEQLDMDLYEVVCKDCWEEMKADLDKKWYSEYDDLGIDTRTGEPFGDPIDESKKNPSEIREAETKKTGKEPVKNVAVDVFYNNNVACASRGADSDEPNKHLKFNTLGKGVDLCIATIVLEKIYDYESLEDICEALEVENKKEITLDVLTDWLDNVDYTGGDPVVFSIEIDGEKVYDGGLDPEEWENTWDDEAKEEAYDAISDELIDDYDGSAEDVDTDAIYDDVTSEWDSWAKEHDPDNYGVDDFVDEFLEEHSVDDYIDEDGDEGEDDE